MIMVYETFNVFYNKFDTSVRIVMQGTQTKW